MIKLTVDVSTDKELDGFDVDDMDSSGPIGWKKTEEYTGLNIFDIIKQVNKKYDLTNIEFDEDPEDLYAIYNSEIEKNGNEISYFVEIYD